MGTSLKVREGNWGGREVQLMTSRSVKMGAAVAGGAPRDQTESLQKKRPKQGKNSSCKFASESKTTMFLCPVKNR